MTNWHENKNAKIGIMGGAFNPFHNGHIRHAIEVLDRMSLDHIEILPSAHHPHKSGLLPFELRLEYVECAIKNIPFLSANTMEKDISAPSYTEKILTAWREKHPLHKPYFLLGTEDFAVLETWKNGLELPKLTHLVIVSRHGSDAGLVCKFAQKYWKEIYISHEDIANTSSGNFFSGDNAGNNSGDSLMGNNSSDNTFLDDNPSGNSLIIADHYKKFTPNSQEERQINKVEKLQIAIPDKGFCTYLHIPHIDISATQIRRLWAQKKCLSGLIPESVQNLLGEHADTLKKYW